MALLFQDARINQIFQKESDYLVNDLPEKTREYVELQALKYLRSHGGNRVFPPAVAACHQSWNFSLNYHRDDREPYLNQTFDNVTLIGKGSFGLVYKAQSRDDNCNYAIKVQTRNPQERREVLFGENLHHPNLVKFHFAWEDHFMVHIQMDCYDSSVDQIFHANGNRPFSDRFVYFLFVDMCRALKYIHSKDIVHLDVKPANVMASIDGTFHLGDFGLALKVDTSSTVHFPTRPPTSDGDARYMAKEVLQYIYTDKADVFSLGMMLLELGSGIQLPSRGKMWHLLRQGVIPYEFWLNGKS